MRAARGLVVLVAAVAIGFAYYLSARGDGEAGGARAARDDGEADGAPKSVQPAGDAVRIDFSFSSNLEEMFVPLIERFNAEQVDVVGRPIFVRGLPASSGDAEAQIVRGSLRPHAWSPASSLWGRLLNHEADRAYTADENPSLVRSPVVIAMWEPLARALGWPTKPIGFADILTLATTKSSWAAYGKPTFGEFRLGHTNPDFSTSGLSFVAAQYYTAAGKREGLTIEDVRRPQIRAKVRAIEQSIVHYGDTGSFFAEQLEAHGPAYASAVAMEETTLLEFNRGRGRDEMKLAAIYPAEGTYVSDNPYMVLDAPWVTAAQRDAAETFGRWLQEQLSPQLVARFGYRSGDPDVLPRAPVTRQNGVLPEQPRRLLSLPEPRVLAEIKEAWHEDRKAGNILLVVDVSGSMNDDDKIGQARSGLQTFLRQLSPRDRVGLMTFSAQAEEIVPIGEFRRNRELVRTRVAELIPDGVTSLYDATEAGWQAVDRLADDTRINAVVVLSDGEDTASSRDLDEVLASLEERAQGEGRQIRVFTIAYGKDASEDVLEKLATASGGKAYVGDPETIETVYVQISSYF